MNNDYRNMVDLIANNIVNELTRLDNDPEHEEINEDYPVREDPDLGFQVLNGETVKILDQKNFLTDERILSFEACKLVVNNSACLERLAVENEEALFDLCFSSLLTDVVQRAKEIRPQWDFDY